MGVDERDSRRATEDVYAVPVGERVGYASSASGAVRYRELAMADDGPVLGYLWYSDEEDAAGYVANMAAGDKAVNAGAYWYDRLTSAQQRGIQPSAALAELVVERAGGPAAGWLRPGVEAEATSVTQLQESAGHSAPGSRSVQRGRRREWGT